MSSSASFCGSSFLASALTLCFAPHLSINKWTPLQREKIAYSAGLIIAQGFASLELFQNLTKEHLLKDGQSPFSFGALQACSD